MMKMVMMMADAARLEAVRHDLAELDVPGYTVLPVEEGSGRTGMHAGDRVHPGALALLIAIDVAEKAERLFEGLRKRRDDRGDTVSRLFLLPVERQA
jgi:nitrogen regulatory protein PII